MPPADPYLAADDPARAVAASLMSTARHAALAVTDPATNTPGISRIAFGLTPANTPLTLISTLSAHWRALLTNPACAFMLGEPPARGDPLTHPRLMVQARAEVLPKDPTLSTHWLRTHPKAKLYIDFADFHFVAFHPTAATLNAGFARAYRLTPQDLAQ
ncbi:MAG: pyridoxamine 5'-phosphate oxidase family protein [Paracoccaceae bacterium]